MHLKLALDRVRLRLGAQPIVTRFAPSPTGYLHMGHVVNALFVWGIADYLGGKVVLRIENHDRARCKPVYENALLQDMAWLGLEVDFGKPAELSAGSSDYRQSDCALHYQQAIARLQVNGNVYACDCSRKRIQERTGEANTDELRYDGYCRARGLEDGSGKTLRLRLPDYPVQFEDILLGPIIQHPLHDIGDFALRDNHGNWTYQFAVVVDDIRHGINLIIRGMDILTSTGRQLMLAEMLGQKEPPIYFHHPLLVDGHGRKLSKRDFSADIHQLNLAGVDRGQVWKDAAKLAGIDLDARALIDRRIRFEY